MTGPADTDLERLCVEAARLTSDTPLAAEVERLTARLHGPLRVAIAGRVKAGKSTLLNALVGERLAPTDAGECTRVVWWFQEGLTYDVDARMLSGPSRALPFHRVDGALAVDVSGIELTDLDRVEVRWPSSALRTLSLIDTPGLASLDDTTSVRTRDFLRIEDDHPGDADAVIYLMRHVHRSDADFLDAFVDRSLDNASPVNAIAVLSRADEIGAGRIDAMESARRIATRIGDDERIRSMCVGVVPVAGLIAETGQTLREDEAASFRALAALPVDVRSELLVSADRFVALDAGAVTSETRAGRCWPVWGCSASGWCSRPSTKRQPSPPPICHDDWSTSRASTICVVSWPSTSCPGPGPCRPALFSPVCGPSPVNWPSSTPARAPRSTRQWRRPRVAPIR